MSELPQLPRKQSRGCWLYGCLFLFLAPVLLVILAGGLFLGRERSAAKQLNARIDRLNAQGMPVDDTSLASTFQERTSEEDIASWLQILDELNGQEFRSASQNVPVFDGDPSNQVPEQQVASDIWTQEKATRDLLSQADELLARIDELAARQLQIGTKPPRFPLQFNSISTDLNEVQNLRQVARLLRVV